MALPAAPLPPPAPREQGSPAPRTEQPTLALHRARRVAFYSHSGGSGRTTLAFECATMVASLAGTRVAVIGLDGDSSSLRVRTGLAGPDLFEEVAPGGLDGPALERVLLRHPGGTRVAFGSTAAPPAETVARNVGALLDHLDAAGYALVVIDLGTAAFDCDSLLAATIGPALDDVYCVFNPTPGSIMGLYRAVATLRRLGLRERVRLVLNRHDAPISLDEVLGDLRLDLVTSIPTLRGIVAAELSHAPACLDDEAVADAIYGLAEHVYPDMTQRWFEGAGRRLQAGGGLES